MKRIFAFMFFICFAGITALYGADDPKLFQIGGLFPMTGPQAYYGRVMSRGALLAIDHLNTAGGVEDYKIKLNIVDFQNVDPNLAMIGIQKLIITKKIPFLLTSFSAITLAVQPVCETGHVLMINGGAHSPKLMNKPYLYNIKLSQSQMITPMLKFLQEMNIKKLGIIYSSDVGEAAFKEYLQPIWETQMGGSIAAAESHKAGITDYTPYLNRIKEGNPDAIYDISSGQDQAYLVKDARALGMNMPISVVDWTPDNYAIAGKASENVYVPVDYFDPKGASPLTAHFVKDYESKWKEPPDLYAANYYDAVYNILAELIKRVAKKGGNPFNGGELENAIWQNPSFDTVYGDKLKFRKDGSSDKPMAIFKIVDGKMVVEKRVVSE